MENVKRTKLAEMNQLDLFLKGARNYIVKKELKEACIKSIVDDAIERTTRDIDAYSEVSVCREKIACAMRLSLEGLVTGQSNSEPMCKLKEILGDEGITGFDAFAEVMRMIRSYLTGTGHNIQLSESGDYTALIVLFIENNEEPTLDLMPFGLMQSKLSNHIETALLDLLVNRVKDYVKVHYTKEVTIREVMEDYFTTANADGKYKQVIDVDGKTMHIVVELSPSILSEECRAKYISLLSDTTISTDEIKGLICAYLKESGVEGRVFIFDRKSNKIEFEIRFNR